MALPLSPKGHWEEGVCLSDLNTRDTALSSDYPHVNFLGLLFQFWALALATKGLVWQGQRIRPLMSWGNGQDFHFGVLRVMEEVTPSITGLWA